MKLTLEKFDAVIFDMDGVLINSEPFYMEVEKQNFRKLGLNISNEEHQTFQGTATDLMWKILKSKYEIAYSVDELVEMTNAVVTQYFQSLKVIAPMPGVEKLLQHLFEKGTPLALASSSYPDVIQLILAKTGLKKYFKTIVDSQMAGASKPEPDIFLLAAKKLHIPPEKCLVIEDSTNGIKAAKTAGMKAVAFAGPGSESQDQSEADWIIRDFGDLIG